MDRRGFLRVLKAAPVAAALAVVPVAASAAAASGSACERCHEPLERGEDGEWNGYVVLGGPHSALTCNQSCAQVLGLRWMAEDRARPDFDQSSYQYRDTRYLGSH
jgi:hypothetical protein